MARVITDLRAQFVNLRATADPDEERIDSEGIIPDIGYGFSGMTEDEASVQTYVRSEVEDRMLNMVYYWIEYSSYSELPEYGDSSMLYFIINHEDEDNPVFQEYIWIDTYYDYDEETEEETEVEGHYELQYDLYP